VSLTAAVMVGLLGGVGAVCRLVLDGAVSARAGRSLPWGTFVVNISGAVLLGVLVGAIVSPGVYRTFGVGLVGGFTTFSTWALESHRLGEDGRLRYGVANLAGSLVVGVLAAWAGRHVGAAL
jgi:CrcB protein